MSTQSFHGVAIRLILPIGHVQKAQGAALLMVMILILVMSALTFNSIKSTTIHTRLASNQVATERTFQAAESVIDRIYREGQIVSSNRFAEAVLSGVQFDCLTQKDFLPQKCSRQNTFDSYGSFSTEHGNSLISAAQTRYMGDIIASGFDAKSFSYKHFSTQGASFFTPDKRVNFATENRLHWKKFGPKNSFNRAQ
jgi:Tfp pilus assembly protein PilX